MSRRSQRRKKAVGRKRGERRKGRIVRGVGLFAGSVLVLLLLVVLGGMLWVRSYVRGEDFRVLLEKQVGRGLGAEVSLTDLEWEGSAVRTEVLEVGNAGMEFSGQRVSTRVDLGGIWEGVWRVPLVKLVKAEGSWDLRGRRGGGGGSGG
ncbi:MAG: hypothetical protein AAGC74_11275, partial [Verrucomicrobiota bacterium]